jgi:hypothetical protein
MANHAPMGALLDLVREAEVDSSIAFRAGVYRRGEQGELLRDVIALANAPVVGRRFLVMGADDAPARRRAFPGLSTRSWSNFCAIAPDYLARTVEPALSIRLESVEVDDALVGVLCLDSCEDPPYLLCRRVGPALPAGAGWTRGRGKPRRLLRKDFERIFSARLRRQELGDVTVGFPGSLPREEVELPVMPLEALPSMLEADKIERLLEAKRVSRAVLGRTDSHIVRLVHTQVAGSAMPYEERGTRTMQVLLEDLPRVNAAADEFYQYEERAHRINLLLQNLTDRAHTGLVLTLKIPRIEGVGIAEKLYAAPGEHRRRALYPKVDVGPRTIIVQVPDLRIPRRGTVEAFLEPVRLLLREPAAGKTLRVAYSLQGSTLERPVAGRLKIHILA